MIEPVGTWDEMWTNTRFKHLTRVDFLDDYSVAMGQIAGKVGRGVAGRTGVVGTQ